MTQGTLIHILAGCGLRCSPVSQPAESPRAFTGASRILLAATHETPYLGAEAVWRASSGWNWFFENRIATPPVSNVLGLPPPDHGATTSSASPPPGLRLRRRDTGVPGAVLGRPEVRPAHRPADHECDEYPFASTLEGAAAQSFGTTFFFTGGINGGGETFACGVTWLPLRRTYTAGGFSARFIPRSDNSGGGTELAKFYIDYRVIPGDRFTVRVV